MFAINLNDKSSIQWSKKQLSNTLRSLASAKKEVVWIRSDLTTSESNWFTRVIWTYIAKHFDWMRRNLYNVDLEKSREILGKLLEQLPNNAKLIDLYNKAALNFNNEIAPNHKIKEIQVVCR